ncbi:hypothetical protein DL770_006333 [Monosporascus sp. CRB-9-2]|nr:hypothetical protein DL770_006333 [Monosporascus sp. CRB-9-2]
MCLNILKGGRCELNAASYPPRGAQPCIAPPQPPPGDSTEHHEHGNRGVAAHTSNTGARQLATSVPLAAGPARRVWLKPSTPSTKAPMEYSAPSYSAGVSAGRCAAPSARNTVLPICIDADTDDALNAMLSQSPEITLHRHPEMLAGFCRCPCIGGWAPDPPWSQLAPRGIKIAVVNNCIWVVPEISLLQNRDSSL